MRRKKAMPTPKSPKIEVSELQRSILEQIQGQRKSSVTEVARSRIILEISKGYPNTKVSEKLGVQYDQVKRWRKRWLSFQAAFTALETGPDDGHLRHWMTKKIKECLADAPRSGRSYTFTAEQYCQIIAISLEDPAQSGRPISEWTPKEITNEAIKRGIVTSISSNQVRLFLKGKRNQTP
ncbi:MAG: helix-turn-helix domain-containing protein [Saprospiraceae bacterium]|nr:helix-turn-helix domain-containing protein [Saprospiraceae bacterium]